VPKPVPQSVRLEAPRGTHNYSEQDLFGFLRVLLNYRVAKTHRMPYVAGHFRKRATNYRALLQKMTYEDKESYDSLPPCSVQCLVGADERKGA